MKRSTKKHDVKISEYFLDTASQLQIKPDEVLSNSSQIIYRPDKFEAYVFANFDICNFSRYKSENRDWVKLLERFLNTIVSTDASWNMEKFWKFNGDSATFRKRVSSIEEICMFINQAQMHLEHLQNYLTEISKFGTKIYVKAAVWVAGFLEVSPEHVSASNNTRFQKSPFGEEFVGENIDEGFRLAACSKAGKLVIDPKIVLIIHSYLNDYYCRKKSEDSSAQSDNSISSNNDHASIFRKSIANNPIPDKAEKYLKLLSDIDDSCYLMEYAKCKGIWHDRDYPIFWYIPNLENSELIYDENVNEDDLRSHKVYKLKYKLPFASSSPEAADEVTEIKRELQFEKEQLISIFDQNQTIPAICVLINNLRHMPEGNSEETIFETANLYYMIACVVVKDNEDQGILIFRRSNERLHLKYVWDLVPIKHGTTYNSDKSNYGIADYLQSMLKTHLNLSDDLIESVKIEKDTYRNSIRPLAFCNVFRGGKAHNGVLCVAEITLKEDVNVFLEKLKTRIKMEKRFSDVELIPFGAIDSDSGSETDSKYQDIIHINGKKIISLSPSDVKKDSNEVAIHPKNAIFKPKKDDDYEMGISYLGHSIKQILEERQRRKDPIDVQTE